MRLFLDAVVLFSAAYSPNGRALALFRLASTGRCSLSASRHVIEEARRNLIIKAPEQVDEFERLLEYLQTVPEAPPKLVAWAAGHGLRANDAPVLAAAALGGADLLATGDRTHFGHLFGKEIAGVTIVSLAEALERVL